MFWKVSFRERDDIPEDIFKRTGLKEITEDNEYISRYDLTYLTPCFYKLRCKVWVAKSSVKKKLDDIPIPFSDVKNVLEEIQFEDETTQSHCRGWLVFKSRKYLQTDILFPGCELDCRFTMRERRGKSNNFCLVFVFIKRTSPCFTFHSPPTPPLLLSSPSHLSTTKFSVKHHFCCLISLKEQECHLYTFCSISFCKFPFWLENRTAIRGDVPEIEVRRALSAYLSRLTLTDKDAFGLLLPDHDFPEGFHLLHKRCCKRKMYSTRAGFFAILSQEDSWSIDFSGNETSRESTDLHLHSEECDKLLSSTDWQPETIVQKLPELIQFVKEIQDFVVREMKGNGSTRTVPPEIRARGPLALEAYNNALAEGQACVKRVPLMIVGQDRAGKTSVKKSLKGICFNPDEDSTLGIEVDRYDFKVTTEIWKTGEIDEEANIDTTVTSFEHSAARWIAEKLTMHEKIAEVKQTSSTESAGYDFEEIDDAKEGEPYETLSDANLLESSINPASTNTTDDEPNLSTREDFDDVVKLLPQFLRENSKDDKEDIYSILWDFAGQSVYYVTHPIFLTRRAIYFLVYDLSRNPSDKAKPLVKRGVYREIEDRYNLKTNFDYLDFWMSSLASLVSDCQQVEPEKLVPLRKFPAVFLVCTHADQPYCDHNPFKLASEIFGDLKNKPYGAHLFDVFCVDNTKSGTESECKEIVRLREAVHVVSRELPHVTEAIPIKWLKYENVLRVLMEKDQKFISLSRLRKKSLPSVATLTTTRYRQCLPFFTTCKY
ncbi:unnamed protein product [Pocillopora meandrina]|uniref:Uncharacterized protein n=1 Tax=Pocillopora meandrina TaxID=46732 RepID=A0AAU9Y516_9CNID|nr:unnamed protein product [Pocillopora meandrina]